MNKKFDENDIIYRTCRFHRCCDYYDQRKKECCKCVNSNCRHYKEIEEEIKIHKMQNMFFGY